MIRQTFGMFTYDRCSLFDILARQRFADQECCRGVGGERPGGRSSDTNGCFHNHVVFHGHGGRDPDDGIAARRVSNLAISVLDARCRSRNIDCHQHFFSFERSGHDVEEKIFGCNTSPSIRTLKLQLGFERYDDGRPIRCGVRVSERATDGTAIAYLRIGDRVIGVPRFRRRSPRWRFVCSARRPIRNPVRLQALVDHNGKIEGNAPFAWIESCPSLLAGDAIDQLMKTVDQVAAKLRHDFDLPLSLIFFDTMILAAGYTKDGGDNDTTTTNAVFKAMTLLSQRAGCFVLGVDHFGKAVETGTRGSSAKEGNADLVLALLGERTITGEITDTKLAIRKRRSGGSGQEFPFKPQIIDMGLDARGKPVTTVVINWGAPGGDQPKSDKKSKERWGKSKGTIHLRRTMMNLADAGKTLKPWADGPAVLAIELAIVRREYCKSWIGAGTDGETTQAAKRMAFHRAIADAQYRQVIAGREIGGVDYIWQTGPGGSPDLFSDPPKTP